MDLLQGVNAQIGVVLINATTGLEQTGVTSGAVTLYCFYGSNSVSTHITGFTWVEVDSTNMPGLYQLTIPLSFINTVGDFIVYASASGTFIAKREFRITAYTTDTIGTNLASTTTTVNTVNTNVSATETTVNTINTKIGTPISASVSADIANVPIGVWGIQRISHTSTGDYGETMGFLYSTHRGHVQIVQASNSLNVYTEAKTTIAVGSNGQNLPQTTISVGSTTGFLPSGTIIVQTSLGLQTVTYTGVTGLSFTGCSGGTGLMTTGNSVEGILYNLLLFDLSGNPTSTNPTERGT